MHPSCGNKTTTHISLMVLMIDHVLPSDPEGVTVDSPIFIPKKHDFLAMCVRNGGVAAFFECEIMFDRLLANISNVYPLSCFPTKQHMDLNG